MSARKVRGVEISKPDKEMFPADGLTKLDVARYYDEVAQVMLRHVRGRPLSLQRFPDGSEAGGFYEKRVPRHFPDWVGRVRVATANGCQEQVVADDARTLVYLADQACLTPHAWLCRADALDAPDQLVFDLDPSVDDLAGVRRATVLTGELLDALGLTAYVKTTGSRGYHVLVPLRVAETFEGVRAFARDVARRLAELHPDLLTVEQRKAERGRRVLVDVMRNGYGQTAVPAYAVRALPGAPVSAPIEWNELCDVEPQRFTVTNVRRRLAQRGDPWRDVRRHAQGLGRARERLARLDT